MKNEEPIKNKSDQDNKIPRILKILFLGKDRVGKSSIINVIMNKQLNSKYDQTIYDEFNYQLDTHRHQKFVDNKIYNEYTLKLIDTGNFSDSYCFFMKDLEDTDYFFIVYSVEDEKSFDSIKNIVKKLKETGVILNETNTILIGNKIDLELEKISVDTIKCHKYIVAYPMNFIEVSAKSQMNIDNLLNILFSLEVEKYTKKEEKKKEWCRCF